MRLGDVTHASNDTTRHERDIPGDKVNPERRED